MYTLPIKFPSRIMEEMILLIHSNTTVNRPESLFVMKQSAENNSISDYAYFI